MLEKFDLRFIVIADYLNGSRTVEDIKRRYYEVARTVLIHRGEIEHPIVKNPYNYFYDIRRKTNLEKAMQQTADQHYKE